MDLSNYKLVKSSNYFGISVSKYSPIEEENSEKLPIVVSELGVAGLLNSTGLLAILIMISNPQYLLTTSLFILLMPFGGRDLNGNKCGPIQLSGMGYGEEKGFGSKKHISYTINSVPIKMRWPLAIGGALTFLLISGVITDAFCKEGYRGLLHNPNDASQMCVSE